MNELRMRVERSRAREGSPHLWPSTGEYPVYDTALYYLMTRDRARNDAFRVAIQTHAPGRQVVDVGTGVDANWAIAAARAGATGVVAFEQMRSAFEAAGANVRAIGFGDTIDMVYGSVNDTDLGPNFDMAVSETIGSIASSEGLVHIADTCRERLLKPGGVFVPHRVVTMAAPANISGLLSGSTPAFSRHGALYVRKIFEWNGAPFDLRVCVANPDRAGLLADGVVVEDLSLNADATWTSAPGEGTIVEDGSVDGVALWVRLWTYAGAPELDALAMSTNWGLVFLPIFETPVAVSRGQSFRISLEAVFTSDAIHPDYRATLSLSPAGAERGEAAGTCYSPYAGDIWGGDALHRHLFLLD